VYELTMLVAPVGNEALYTQLASIPMFVAKLFAGLRIAPYRIHGVFLKHTRFYRIVVWSVVAKVL
jgi:hypothetical protein